MNLPRIIKVVTLGNLGSLGQGFLPSIHLQYTVNDLKESLTSDAKTKKQGSRKGRER